MQCAMYSLQKTVEALARTEMGIGQSLAHVPNLARELVSVARERGHGNESTKKQQQKFH